MNSDFELRLAHELRDYAAVAAGPATDAEIERALAARPVARRLTWQMGLTSRRTLLVAAATALLLVGAAVVGALLLRDARPTAPFRLSILATGSPESIFEWDADANAWTQISNDVSYGQSPDGRWLTFGSFELNLRALGPGARGQAVVWRRVDRPDGGQTLPIGTWSRDSNGLLAILPDRSLRVADILDRPIAVPPEAEVRVSTYSGFPEDVSDFVWDRVGTDGHPRIVAISRSGAVYVLDTSRGPAVAVATVPAWPADPDSESGPQLALASDGNRAITVGKDGGVYLVDLLGGNVEAIAGDAALANQLLWGWSPDDHWVGVGGRMIDVLSHELFALPGAAATGCSSRPAWGPRGHAVAWLGDGFLRIRDDAGTVVERRIECPSGPETTGTSVAWRPDGGAVAIAMSALGADTQPLGGSVVMFDIEENHWTAIASDDRSYMHYTIHWVPIP